MPILKQIHKGHPGIERMKAIARSYVYWPGIDKEIEQFVKTCHNFASAAKSPIKVPLASWYTPTHPWQRFHADYAGPINGEYYLIVVDAFSKWPEIYPTQTITAQRTIEIMEDIFARFGIPETLVTDNGTQFTSEMFQTFCLSRGIQHFRTPAFNPSSNSQAERFVDTFKRGLQKHINGETIRKHLPTFLKQYRSTPNSNAPDKVSPAEALMGRPMRTVLDLLKPSVQRQLHKDDSKLRQKRQYNRKHGVKPKTFEVDSEVYVKIYRNNKWE